LKESNFYLPLKFYRGNVDINAVSMFNIILRDLGVIAVLGKSHIREHDLISFDIFLRYLRHSVIQSRVKARGFRYLENKLNKKSKR